MAILAYNTKWRCYIATRNGLDQVIDESGWIVAWVTLTEEGGYTSELELEVKAGGAPMSFVKR